MQRLQKHFYEFGLFRIDTEERQLLRDDKPVALTPKVFDLLLVLVENSGHTLGKNELMSRVWAGTFVEENNLSRNISMLRKILGDTSNDPRFIKTVPKRGYRFEQDVQEILEDNEALVVEKHTSYSVALRQEIHKDTVSFSVTGLISQYRLVIASIATAVLIATLAWTIDRTQKNEALSLTFAENEKQPAIRGTANAEAFELYERGRKLWQNRSAAGLHEATLLLEQAVEKDPGFALGHAALADAYAFDGWKWKMTENIANEAIQLDARLGEPHASIGFVRLFWEWNPTEAEVHFRKSVTLSPDYATGHQWLAIKFAASGQFNQAFTEMNRALELEPESIAVNADMCHMLYLLKKYDEAETQCKKTLELDANSFNVHRYLYQIYVAKKMYPEAVTEFFESERLSVNHSTLPAQLEKLRSAFERGGIRAFWREHIGILSRQPIGNGYTMAQYYSLLGEKDEALQHLQRAYENREFGFVLFGADPVFSQFSEDPRYLELHARLFDRQIGKL